MSDDIYQRDAVSTIIRFHRIRDIYFLERAIGTLLAQQYTPIETIIALQNFTNKDFKKVEDLSKKFQGYDYFRVKVINFEFNDQDDHRATLLNRAISYAEGRYLGFLDYDDIIYPNAYKLLVERLIMSEKAVAVGGVMQTEFMNVSGSTYTIRKHPLFQGKHKLDFYFSNQYPIHSYLIDRNRIDKIPLFPENVSRHEDYWFLLTLLSKYDFDDFLCEKMICEYLVDVDGSNTILAFKNDKESKELWKNATKAVEQMKEELTINIKFTDFTDYIKICEERAALKQIRQVTTDLSASDYATKIFCKEGNMKKKYRKFLRDPHQFFDDSRKPGLRLLKYLF